MRFLNHLFSNPVRICASSESSNSGSGGKLGSDATGMQELASTKGPEFGNEAYPRRKYNRDIG